MSRQVKSWKREYKSRLRKLSKKRPNVWKRAALRDWAVTGYTKEGYQFYGSYETKELADIAADLIYLEQHGKEYVNSSR